MVFHLSAMALVRSVIFPGPPKLPSSNSGITLTASLQNNENWFGAFFGRIGASLCNSGSKGTVPGGGLSSSSSSSSPSSSLSLHCAMLNSSSSESESSSILFLFLAVASASFANCNRSSSFDFVFALTFLGGANLMNLHFLCTCGRRQVSRVSSHYGIQIRHTMIIRTTMMRIFQFNTLIGNFMEGSCWSINC